MEIITDQGSQNQATKKWVFGFFSCNMQSIQRWQSRVVLESLPSNEYVITESGQFRCAICSGLPPFKTGSELAVAIV